MTVTRVCARWGVPKSSDIGGMKREVLKQCCVVDGSLDQLGRGVIDIATRTSGCFA